MIRPIKTKKDYENALERVYEIMQMDLKTDSEELNELEVLSILIENYESKKFPMEFPDPVEAIKFKLEQMNYNYSYLVEILGSRSRVSEIMNKKRGLSINMIRALHEKLNIPLSSLISKSN